MIEPETKCKTCLGCERLAIPEFKEVYRCENYVRGVAKDDIFTNNNIFTTNNSN